MCGKVCEAKKSVWTKTVEVEQDIMWCVCLRDLEKTVCPGVGR